MGREGKAEEYTGKGYLKGAFKIYLPVYEAAISHLPDSEKCDTVIDLGCGIGYFAKVLFKRGYKRYLGIDFSCVMIKHARSQVPEATFILGDLRNEEIRKILRSNKIFVALEVFEHIEKDLEIIEDISSNSLVIFSVPSFDSQFHVRYFKDKKDIVKRYEHLLNFESSCVRIRRKIFLSKCIRK